jgi:hypothetical protein
VASTGTVTCAWLGIGASQCEDAKGGCQAAIR